MSRVYYETMQLGTNTNSERAILILCSWFHLESHELTNMWHSLCPLLITKLGHDVLCYV